MNGRDRSSFGEEINYGTFKLIYIKAIYNFLSQNWIVTSSYLVKKNCQRVYVIHMSLIIPQVLHKTSKVKYRITIIVYVYNAKTYSIQNFHIFSLMVNKF